MPTGNAPRQLDSEAIQVDAYIDELLSGTRAGPRAVHDPEAIDPALEATAHLVRRALARFHPSFGFEERLSRRLLEAATSGSVESRPIGSAVAGSPEVLPFPRTVALLPTGGTAGARPTGIPDRWADRQRRSGLILGSAIASGVSLAGVSIARAYLVRRRGRPGLAGQVRA
jgi:hypothetical protein